MDRLAETPTYGQKGWQAEGQADEQLNRRTNEQTDGPADSRAYLEKLRLFICKSQKNILSSLYIGSKYRT